MSKKKVEDIIRDATVDDLMDEVEYLREEIEVKEEEIFRLKHIIGLMGKVIDE
jgi:hypothetical protein